MKVVRTSQTQDIVEEEVTEFPDGKTKRRDKNDSEVSGLST